jgi:hypothetical protein
VTDFEIIQNAEGVDTGVSGAGDRQITRARNKGTEIDKSWEPKVWQVVAEKTAINCSAEL